MDFEVLILGTDPNAYYMARCCFEAYHKKAYLIGTKRLAFTKFSNILHVSYEPKMWDEKEFIKILNNFAAEHADRKIILISTNETYVEFITNNRKKLSDQFVYNYPDVEIIRNLIDKEKFYKTYINQGLQFPKTYYYDCQKEFKVPDEFDYPIILKPADVVKYNHVDFEGKNKIYKINSEEELYEIIGKIQASNYDGKLIIQEFIPGDDSNLFDSVVYVNTKGKVEFITFAQIGLQEHTKSMVGNAAVLINGFNTTNGNVPKMIKDIKKFMENINYRGFAEVDMKYDERDNTFKVLEINARQGRSSYYVTKLGKNLVKTIVDDALYDIQSDYKTLDSEVLLSFVPKGVVRKYISNKDVRRKALKMWHSVIKPMDAPQDRNFKRFLMLRKRWLNYYKEYKNGYWK